MPGRKIFRSSLGRYVLVRGADIRPAPTREGAEYIAGLISEGGDSSLGDQEAITRGLLDGSLKVVRIAERPGPLEAPKAQDLRDLLPPEAEGGTTLEPSRRHSIALKVVDQNGRPLAGFFVEVKLPDGRVERRALGTRGTVELEDIEADGTCIARVEPPETGELS